jgi:hypothetical protein
MIAADASNGQERQTYFVCDDCGTQLFVRGPVGRRLLNEVMRKGNSKATEQMKTLLRKAQALAINSDLEALNGYVEIFCEGEIIIRRQSSAPDDQILFTEWPVNCVSDSAT